jgi:hypothetical protein
MPYNNLDRRVEIDSGDSPETPGELNYLLTSLCLEYIGMAPVLSYELLNEVIGVLECAKMEFYRRVGVPYEENKILDNGDVY